MVSRLLFVETVSLGVLTGSRHILPQDVLFFLLRFLQLLLLQCFWLNVVGVAKFGVIHRTHLNQVEVALVFGQQKLAARPNNLVVVKHEEEGEGFLLLGLSVQVSAQVLQLGQVAAPRFEEHVWVALPHLLQEVSL